MTSAPEAGTELVEVDGVGIAWRHLGSPEAGTVLLVHGGAAHSGWWAEVAPVLARDHHVVLADLSGHGDSDHRPAYRAGLWAEEMAAVLRAAGVGTTTGPATVVGHSMGGLVAVATAARFPELVEGLVLVDTRLPLRELPPPTAPARLYVSAQQALDRFRLLPDRTNADSSLLQEIARMGLIEADPGWRWKFDPAARRRLSNVEVREDLAGVRCPVGYLYGAESDMGGPDSAACLQEWLGRPVPAEVVPDAFHHVPLDQPARCAEAIEHMLAELVRR
ncbi:alpha/beta fold hydrolase [Nocardioides sp. NPDC101246]|uniref:alpha/beta fold hydrolase n=1 Tax=Nocardioides sp. NPDC101246 TaxID=3364336 RepID=UPI003827650F